VTRVVLRGLLARRLRLALTAFAVALGVTLVAGTYVFTDTINASFDRIFTKAYEKTDVVISPGDEVTNQDGEKAPMPASVLATVRATDGVATAEGGIFDFGSTVLDTKGKKLGSGGIVASRHDNDRYELFDVASGRLPDTAREVAIDRSTAKNKHLEVGGSLVIAAQVPKATYKIVGIIRIQGVDSLGGSPVTMLTLPEAQRVTGKVNALDEVDASVEKGVDAQALKKDLRAALGPNVNIRTGKEEAASQSKSIRDDLGFLKTALLAFAGISLFVGAFIIFNTFSITVAQRAREFGLLRTLGASRAQVMRSVLGEGLFLGLLGGLAGLGLGIALATGLRALFKAIGFEVPSNGTVIETRTITTSLLVGVLVTMVSTLAPALRATRVPPVAALREGVALPPGRGARFVFPASIVLLALGLGLLALGLFGSSSSSTALTLVGAGAGLMFIGTALLSPRLVPPIAGFIGAPMRGITGRLARENAVRQPGRTAATAAALMVGVALVAFASIFAASARSTIRDAVGNGSRAQLIVQNTDGFSAFSPQAAQRAAQVPGVEKASSLRFAQGKIGKKDVSLTGIDPATFPDLYVAKNTAALRGLSPGTAFVSKSYDDDHHPGPVLRIKAATGKTVALKVGGVYEDKGHLLSDITVTNAQIARDFAARKDNLVLLGTAGPSVTGPVKSALKQDFPQTEALTNKQFVDDQAGQIDQLLALIYALLALAIIVSLFGIVNTLVLSITERTRELGMLRAIGTSRRQIRAMIRYEAIITALLGGILGAGLGVILAVLVSRPIDDFKLAIPVGSLLVLLVLSAIAGVGAAVLPARRAAKLDVLEALAYE
jgi:putative ABC transport system permease protein